MRRTALVIALGSVLAAAHWPSAATAQATVPVAIFLACRDAYGNRRSVGGDATKTTNSRN